MRGESGSRSRQLKQTVYEVAVVNKKQKIEVTLTPGGKIIEIEKQIGQKRLPKTVADALASKYPGASFKMIEEVIKVNDGAEKLVAMERFGHFLSWFHRGERREIVANVRRG